MTKAKDDQTCKRCGLRDSIPGRGTLCEQCRGKCIRCGAPAYQNRSGAYSKWCSPCRRVGEEQQYCCVCRQPRSDSSHPSYCNPCYRTQSRERRRKKPSVYQLKDRRRMLARYGLTVEDFDRILSEQGGGCATCCAVAKEPIVYGGRGPKGQLHVDHDHRTGAVRGILCTGCNVSIGHLKDDPERARRLALYLEKFVAAAAS